MTLFKNNATNSIFVVFFVSYWLDSAAAALAVFTFFCSLVPFPFLLLFCDGVFFFESFFCASFLSILSLLPFRFFFASFFYCINNRSFTSYTLIGFLIRFVQIFTLNCTPVLSIRFGKQRRQGNRNWKVSTWRAREPIRTGRHDDIEKILIIELMKRIQYPNFITIRHLNIGST